jgi:hypothetical protein
MKKLNETPIGNIQPATFRPTEAEKLVLLNIADLQQQGRTVTQQDAINVSEDELKEKQIGEDNLESAFVQLLKLKMVEFKPDQTIEITAAGQPVVDELKKAEDQEALTAQSDKGTPAPGEQPQSNPPGNMQQPNAMQNPDFAESFSLIHYLQDLSKLFD